MLPKAYRITRLLLAPVFVLMLTGGGNAADLCGSDGPPKAGDQRFALADGSCMRLSQNRPGCLDNCMAQCRQAERSCSGPSCRTEFQICARRCVVSCGGR